MKTLLLTLVVGAVSSAFPLVNMETYIVVAYAKTNHPALGLALVGSLGQNIGKLVWYYASRESLDIPWLRRRLESPNRQAQFERWSQVAHGNPWITGLLIFASALVGIPPFFAMAMIAGALRINVVLFFVTGLLGRTLFFWAILAGAHLLLR